MAWSPPSIKARAPINGKPSKSIAPNGARASQKSIATPISNANAARIVLPNVKLADCPNISLNSRVAAVKKIM